MIRMFFLLAIISASSLGYAAEPTGDPNERAIALYTEAIALSPNDSLSYYQRGNAYARLGRLNEALNDFNEAIRLEPKAARSFSNRGNVHSQLKQFDKAIADYNECLRLDPNLVLAHTNRGIAYRITGEYQKALVDFDAAIRLDANDTISWSQKSWLLAACPKDQFRNGRLAVECATKACTLAKWDNYVFIEQLAAAHAEAGDFNAAVKAQEQAMRSIPESSLPRAQTRLELYKAGKPYRFE